MRNKSKKQKAHAWGVVAEYVAAAYLTLKGYHILAQRWRSPFGEVDLIVARGKTLVFVEVKARPELAESLEAVTHRQRTRIAQAALAYTQRFPKRQTMDMRFDVIACAPWRWPHHLPDAWRPDA